ncbi:MAG: serine/threonine-protein kinase [Candidatus Sulfotelmatobacter sp.]
MSSEDVPTQDIDPDLAPTKNLTGAAGEMDQVSPPPPSRPTNPKATDPAADAGPKFIGPYKLIRRLGEGGMGTVWLAEQTAPVQRQVALKLIKFGLYDRELLQRFRAERQSLALMDHPTIAKVFDAGVTPDGQPYFVMEYVPGEPITTYCDQKRLTIRQRLELFIKICEGVQHAHQKAMIHRDLTPPNILVTEVDGRPMPRIIDFGLAKAIDPQIGDDAVMTRAGRWLGTPGYMSPEQAESTADVDTRTDVYSLGVILYVLITGAQPFDTTQWKNLPFHEVVRQLRDNDPPKPSTKIRTHDAEALAELARRRQTDPVTLTRQVTGDLEWIVLQAIEKDRERRYATPLELAADVNRYLQNMPVSAHPASFAYRASKYVRRHRLGVSVTISAAVVLVGFAVTQAIELRAIRQQRDRADLISRFMTGIFKVSNPSEARGNTITAREILDQGSQQITTSLNNDPALQAQLMETMARTYAGLGLTRHAQDLTERALAIRRSLFGERNRATLQTESDLGQLMGAQGHLPEAEKLLQATLQTQRQLLGPNDPDTLASMDRLAYVYANEARQAEAENLFRQTLDAERRVLGPDDQKTMGTLNELAQVLTAQGRYADSDKIYIELIAAQRRTLGPDHPATLLSMSHAAENLSHEGRYSEAEKLYADVVATQRRVLGPEHPQTLRAMTFLAVTMMGEGHYAEAEKLQSEIIDIKRRVLGPAHNSTLQSMELEALCLSNEGRSADAEKMFHDVIMTAEKTGQPGVVAETWYNFACAEADRGHSDAAIANLNHAVENGLVSPGQISADPELKSLHGDPRFNAVIERARATSSARKK